MSYDKVGTWIVTCDFCNKEDLDTDQKDFAEGIKVKKAEGWRSAKHNDEWLDKCPLCFEEKVTLP